MVYKAATGVGTETLLQQLQKSLLAHCRPVQIAFHFYEILSEAGYDDDLISVVNYQVSTSTLPGAGVSTLTA